MRYERKYRVNHLGLSEVTALVRKHPLSFRTAYPDRQVNNVYLDTHDLHDFNENLMGISQRRKFRVRWYGDDLHQAVQPVLEVKVRDSGLGDKLLFPLADMDISTPQRMRRQVAERLRDVRAHLWAQGGATELGGFPLGDLRPVLLNTYQRAYYVSLDGRFRLTIDHDLRFYNPDFRVLPGSNALEDRALIVEVKYDAVHDADFDALSRHLPLVLSRNSKYVTGILLTTGI